VGLWCAQEFDAVPLRVQLVAKDRIPVAVRSGGNRNDERGPGQGAPLSVDLLPVVPHKTVEGTTP
jgi:hypothetical protein